MAESMYPYLKEKLTEPGWILQGATFNEWIETDTVVQAPDRVDPVRR